MTLNYGLRYEAPGNPTASLYAWNDRVVATNGGRDVFRLTPRPGRDLDNFQPRFGFSWNPQVARSGLLGRLSGSGLVIRGGYSRTNDFGFINIPLNIISAFPFVASVNLPAGTPNVYQALASTPIDLSNPATINVSYDRTIVAQDYRSPIGDQFSLEMQRQIRANTVLRIGWVGTKGTALFQTLDGNPRSVCEVMPTNAAGTPTGCPRVNPLAGTVRLRANSSSSIYHSLQMSLDRRLWKNFSGGAHYTWSSFIDDASDVFNPSGSGDMGVSQDSFNRRSDRGRSTFDRPHRFAANFVYELPFRRTQAGAAGRLLGGWQLASFVTFQSGSPFSPLNGSDPALALEGISGMVGNAIRPNVATNLDVSTSSIEELYAVRGSVTVAGNALFTTLPGCQRIAATNTCRVLQRVGTAGRNILRSDGIQNIDFSLLKSIRISESHRLQFRADLFNLANTRNFGIPDASVTSNGFLNQWGTDGGNRRVFVSLRYAF